MHTSRPFKNNRLIRKFERGRRLADTFSSTSALWKASIKPTVPEQGIPLCQTFHLTRLPNQVNNMSVSFIKKVMGTTATRQREEMRLISRHKTLAPHGINID